MLVSEILRIKGNALFTTAPDGSVLDAVKVMAQHDIGSLVVMDHGRMIGMLTFAEVLEALAKRQGQLGDLKVSEIQVGDPLTATTDSTSWNCGASCSSATRGTSRSSTAARCSAWSRSTTSPRRCTTSRASRTGC
jgi:hypothetical protein